MEYIKRTPKQKGKGKGKKKKKKKKKNRNDPQKPADKITPKCPTTETQRPQRDLGYIRTARGLLPFTRLEPTPLHRS
jgi:hypothetical protein